MFNTIILKNGKKVNSEHVEQLRGSGITSPELIERVGLYSATMDELQGIFRRRDIASGGLVFPYPGVVGFKRVRLDNPIYTDSTDDGYGNRESGLREIRYLSKKGSSNHLYLPLPEDEFTKNTQIFVTEGEKKALSLTQHGFPAVGVAGVWAWRTVDGICEEFQWLNWRRPVVVVFDSDAATRLAVRSAMKKLAEELSRRGAKVSLCVVPGAGGGSDA